MVTGGSGDDVFLVNQVAGTKLDDYAKIADFSSGDKIGIVGGTLITLAADNTGTLVADEKGTLEGGTNYEIKNGVFSFKDNTEVTAEKVAVALGTVDNGTTVVYKTWNGHALFISDGTAGITQDGTDRVVGIQGLAVPTAGVTGVTVADGYITGFTGA